MKTNPTYEEMLARNRELERKIQEREESEEAIRLFQEALEAGTPFDGVIVDLTIRGGMGGREAIRQMKALDPAVKGIVSSGYSDDPVLADCLAYGFAAALPKPFSMNDLKEAIHKITTTA